jgi:hypothetical protein
MLVLSVYERCVKPLHMACTIEFIGRSLLATFAVR